jgi:predicted regulator of Ras-like GTPase activity (Roadblock/LC7/MglB family)
MLDNNHLILSESHAKAFEAIAVQLVSEALAKAAFILDQDGQILASAGELQGLDTTSLATLAAGNAAATGAMASILRERAFTTQYHEGQSSNIHMQLIGKRVLLLVVFDHRSSLGLVRLRARRAEQKILEQTESMELTSGDQPQGIPEITDEDIDRLFND